VLGRSQPGVWCDPASEARLRDAGDAVRLWPAEIGTGRVGRERHTGAPRSLGVVDLIGKGGHIRTVPIPNWVKTALDGGGRNQ
jgi:hypothetical protein